MILSALFAPFIAGAIFLATLFPPRRLPFTRATTKAEREAVAASAREFRVLAGRSLLMLALFSLPLLTICVVHHFCEDDFAPRELR